MLLLISCFYQRIFVVLKKKMRFCPGFDVCLSDLVKFVNIGGQECSNEESLGTKTEIRLSLFCQQKTVPLVFLPLPIFTTANARYHRAPVIKGKCDGVVCAMEIEDVYLPERMCSI